MERGTTYIDGQDDSRFEEMGAKPRRRFAQRGRSDGIGELWFDSAAAMEQAMSSPQMAAAVEDAKRFLDMGKTYALVVDEKTVIGEEVAK